MVCTRCSHPLLPRADRCLRCFALNPQNLPPPSARAAGAAPRERAAVAPVSASIASDPPQGLALSIRSEPPVPSAASIASEPPLAAPGAVFSEPAPATPPAPDPQPPDAGPAWAFSSPPPAERQWDPHEAVTEPPEPPPGPGSEVAPAATPPAPALSARLLAWGIDLGLVAACAGAHVWLAIALLGPARLAPRGSGSPDYWLDLLFGSHLAFAWLALAACLGVAYSWLFAALGGRTPGLALAHLKLVGPSGAPLSPGTALARAALALPSAALVAGFALALFDERGQTLHDKLTRARVVSG